MKILCNSCLVLVALFFVVNGSLNAQEKNEFRVLSYNILEGMRLDTTQNKQVFVDWVKDKDPDVLAIQEANGYTQTTLEELAASYGHPYAVITKEWGYSTAITSKHPILFVRRVLDNMYHGFVECKIKGYNFMVIHLDPYRNDEKKRREEIETILQTIQYSPQQEKWLVIGDFNTVSPLDDAHYKGSRDLSLHQYILDAGMVDALKVKHSQFIATLPTQAFMKESSKLVRYDFIYVTPDLKEKIKTVEVLKDNFTDIHSDHYPIVLDLNNN